LSNAINPSEKAAPVEALMNRAPLPATINYGRDLVSDVMDSDAVQYAEPWVKAVGELKTDTLNMPMVQDLKRIATERLGLE
jgi:hypothetical protein